MKEWKGTKREVWRDVPGYLQIYQVSSFGRVKSLERFCKNRNGNRIVRERILKPAIAGGGYFSVSLRKYGIPRTYKISQLVAMAFLNYKLNGFEYVVDHIDENKLNDNIDNLQVITNRQNTSRSTKKSSSKYTGVFWDKYSSSWKAQIYVSGKRLNLGRFNNEHDAYLAYKKELNKVEGKSQSKRTISKCTGE